VERKLTLGFSPCPNDTFIFYALAQKRVRPLGLALDLVIRDVEELNSLVMRRALDVSKISFHTLGYILDSYVLLETGAALGRGCGPLLVTRSQQITLGKVKRVVVPGIHTTATLLLKILYPHVEDLVVMRYDQIMPALARGEAEVGLIIHEGRFTYPFYGLRRLADLGEEWEKKTGLPIPLGGIVAKRSLGSETIKTIQQAILESMKYTRNHPDEAWPYIKKHAQEMDDQVIQSHIDLYVNEYTCHLGEEGRKAVTKLLELARELEIIPPSVHGVFLEEREKG